jgi:hypothetical protein
MAGRVSVDAVAGGHRLIIGCSHNTGASTVAALACPPRLTVPDQPGRPAQPMFDLAAVAAAQASAVLHNDRPADAAAW